MTAPEVGFLGKETEVTEKATRRRFTVEYKRRIVKEADACKLPGEIGELLRREGLYSSHLTTWRAARDRGELGPGAAERKRGPKPNGPDAKDRRIAELERQLARQVKRAERAEEIIEVQKKGSSSPGATVGERGLVMDTVAKLGPRLGISVLCSALGLPRSTYYRRLRPPRNRRRPTPLRKLTAADRQQVLNVLHETRFVDLAPAEVYATLLDEGRNLCSERTMYRVLADNAEVRERRNQLRQPEYKKPELLATAPNSVWSWDITKLLGPTKWTCFHLYVVIDIFSRCVVGWMVAHRESSSLATKLMSECCERQGIQPGQLTIHADRGTSMTSKPVALLLTDLGVTKTHSRPHVSNDSLVGARHMAGAARRRTAPGP